MTELDLQALGIWWIPLSVPAERRGTTVNVWAIEDCTASVTLFGCGPATSESFAALTNGLAEAGATLGDVGRIIVPGGLPDHTGALRWILDAARRPVEVLASRSVRAHLPVQRSTTHELHAGDPVEFRRFGATAMRCGGHLPPLTCLFAERQRLLFSSEQLVDDPGLYARHAGASSSDIDRDAYRVSLARLAELHISVVLPGHGPPFAGHRRVIRDALVRLNSPSAAMRRAAPGDRPRPLRTNSTPPPAEGRQARTGRFGRRHPQSHPQPLLPSRTGESG